MWEFDRIKGEYTGLPVGWRRLWIATSAVWLVGYLILNWESLTFFMRGSFATPQTTCAQIYPDDENRRTFCESEATPGREEISIYMERQRKGLSVPFGPYFNKYREDEKLLIWLAAPAVWLIVIWIIVWVRQGFEADRKQ